MEKTNVTTTKEETMSNFGIVNVLNNLNSFIEKDKELPYKLHRTIVKNHKTLMDEYKIYNEVREKIIKEYHEESSEEKKAEFLKKMEALLNETVTVKIEKLPEDILEGVVLSPKDSMILDFMLETN